MSQFAVFGHFLCVNLILFLKFWRSEIVDHPIWKMLNSDWMVQVWGFYAMSMVWIELKFRPMWDFLSVMTTLFLNFELVIRKRENFWSRAFFPFLNRMVGSGFTGNFRMKLVFFGLKFSVYILEQLFVSTRCFLSWCFRRF